ncbi:MAG: hypothetical protein CL760_01905 [Chloroflexi bacterium]|nr:hypothetical protein [Chloroflexota bacterium]|tara:strand:+ start:1631 stop:2245 length:615 start_codon:yes stop_codon:yes gene_type:complete
MHDYIEISKRAIEYHEQIIRAKQEIEVITFALIGAAAKGLKVSALKYDENEFKQLDLSQHKDVFEQSNKTVEELEDHLLVTHESLQKKALYFKSDNAQIKHHFNMCAKNFLTRYFTISLEDFQFMKKNNIFNDFGIYSEEKNVKGRVLLIGETKELGFFYKDCEDLYKIKNFLTKKGLIFDYTEKEYILDENNEELIPYLYMKK